MEKKNINITFANIFLNLAYFFIKIWLLWEKCNVFQRLYIFGINSTLLLCLGISSQIISNSCLMTSRAPKFLTNHWQWFWENQTDVAHFIWLLVFEKIMQMCIKMKCFPWLTDVWKRIKDVNVITSLVYRLNFGFKGNLKEIVRRKLKGALSGIRQFLATESHLKMIKNDFYFTLRAVFALRIFKFLFWIFGHAWKWLHKTSHLVKKTIAIHILPNISRRKGNQAIKFGELREYNMRKTFIEKSYTKYGGETIPRPFSKNLKLNISMDQ